MSRLSFAAVAVIGLATFAGPAAAQTAPVQKSFASAADIAAATAIAAAKTGNSRLAPLLAVAPLRANIEYRTADAPPALHEHEAELFVVLDGSGTYTGGGTITGPKPPTGGAGTAIVGGTARTVAKGDIFLVPVNSPHQFTAIQGRLVMMSMHLPVAP